MRFQHVVSSSNTLKATIYEVWRERNPQKLLDFLSLKDIKDTPALLWICSILCSNIRKVIFSYRLYCFLDVQPWLCINHDEPPAEFSCFLSAPRQTLYFTNAVIVKLCAGSVSGPFLIHQLSNSSYSRCELAFEISNHVISRAVILERLGWPHYIAEHLFSLAIERISFQPRTLLLKLHTKISKVAQWLTLSQLNAHCQTVWRQ